MDTSYSLFTFKPLGFDPRLTLWLILTLIGASRGGQGQGEIRRSSRLCAQEGWDAVYRYHRETGKCYMVGDRGPCPNLMKFTLEDDNYGVCDCDHSLRCGRPLIYYPTTNQCYFAFQQGPCRPGKWLVFGSYQEPVCKKNPCQSYESEEGSSSGGRYWFSHNGACYRTYTQGYCSHPQEVLFNMKLSYKPDCQRQPDCGPAPQTHQTLTCLPGQKLDVDGKCDRKKLFFSQGKGGLVRQEVIIPATGKPLNIYCLFCDSTTNTKLRKGTLNFRI